MEREFELVEERSQNVIIEDEVDELAVFTSKFLEAQSKVPYKDWSLKRKIIFFLDKAFLSFIALFISFVALFIIIIFLEIVYKMLYNVEWKLIFTYVVTWMSSEDTTGEL